VNGAELKEVSQVLVEPFPFVKKDASGREPGFAIDRKSLLVVQAPARGFRG
jgi:hypothetical protein